MGGLSWRLEWSGCLLHGRIVRSGPEPVKTMPLCQYRNFEITISGEYAPYAITASYGSHSAQGVFHQDMAQPLWQEALALLTDPRRAPGEDQIASVGSQLFEALFQGEIRELWITARADTTADSNLRLRLLIHPPAVAALPWESLYDPRRQQPFGADASQALVRRANRIGYVERTRPLATQLPLKILVAAVDDPLNPNRGIDTAEELVAIEQWLAPLQPHKIQLRILTGQLDIHSLRRQLLKEQPDVFHLISHGEPDGLLLWTPTGEAQMVSGSQVAATLRQVNSLKLVFLNACLAGQPDSKAPFGGVAHRLLQSGLPAVVAMQFEIPDRGAIEFASFLYEALVSGPCPGAVDRAMSVARNNLYITDPGRIEYITPILWLNTDDGIIAQFATAQETAAELAAMPHASERPHINLDLTEKETWFNALPESIEHVGLRFDYQQRRRNIEGLLRQLQRDQAAQQAGTILEAQKVKERLAIFQEERQHLDNLRHLLPPAP